MHLRAIQVILAAVYLFWSAALCCGQSLADIPETSSESVGIYRDKVLPVLESHCFSCHAQGVNEGGLALDQVIDKNQLHDHVLWLKVLRNLRACTMPPSDQSQPDEQQKDAVVQWIKNQSFALDDNHPDPGRVQLRRLNRTEYRNTVKDLLGVSFNTNEEMPADDTGYGFDNIGSVLSVSPTLLDKLMAASQRVVMMAVPTKPYVVAERTVLGREFARHGEEARATSAEDIGISANYLRFLGPEILDAKYLSFAQADSVECLLSCEQSGTFELTVSLQTSERRKSDTDAPKDTSDRCAVSFKVDDKILFERVDQSPMKFTFNTALDKGAHLMLLSLEPIDSKDQAKSNNEEAAQVKRSPLRLRFNSVHIAGPSERELWVRPSRYEEFFGQGFAEEASERHQQVVKILDRFASRAFRRPVDENTVKRLVDIAEDVAAQPEQTSESGVAQAMAAVLASPRFLFREENTEALVEGQKYPFVDEFSLASRLSYFLWSSVPDQRLMDLAGRHELRLHLKSEVDRMLLDPKAEQFVSNFTGQWLQARDIEKMVIDPLSVALREKPDAEVEKARIVFRSLIERDPITYTPEEKAAFDQAESLLNKANSTSKSGLSGPLREAMRRESEMLFEHIVREDRSILEFIDCDYAFLNDVLAKHYGIDGVQGKEMRKVELPADSVRGGILTQATVLVVTSNPTRTSPVKRGVFLLDNVLGMPVAPPPPDIPALEVAAKSENETLSMRDALAAHTSNALCKSCHGRMDPLGLALDNFNALGVWRESELNRPVDAAGNLISGESFTDIRELKRILVGSRRLDFYRCYSEKMLMYATGRGIEYTDTTLLDSIVSELEANHGKMSVLIYGIIDSPAFQQRQSVSSSSFVK